MDNVNAIIASLLLTLALAGFGFAREADQDPGADAEERERAIMAAQLMVFLGPRIDHIAENVSEHLHLDDVPALRASAQVVLKRDDLKALFRDAANAPSLEPFLRAVLARHLSEQQLEDYLAFTQARRDRDRRAAAGQLLAWADQHLSLTPDQRSKLRQIFLLSAGEGMKAQGLLSRDASACMDLAAKLELDAKALKGLLSSSQVKVWDLMMPARNKGSRREAKLDPKEREARFAEVQAGIVKTFKAGRITREQAARKLAAAKQELGADPGVRRSNEVKQEDRIRQIVAAKLAAHTEQLGELDAGASKRLVLVTKGVVEEAVEAWDAGQRDDPTAVVTDHPLYQLTIKDVLAEDAYVRYQAIQAERVAFRDQARRELVVAYLDTQLLLSDTQRSDLAEAAARLTVPKQGNAWTFIAQLLRQVRQVELSPWQSELAAGILKAGLR